MKRGLKIGLLIGWMCLIFMFSHQTAQMSSEASGLIESLLQLIQFMPETLFGLELSLIIRKCAHLFEYFVLGMLFINVLMECYLPYRAGALSLIYVFMYATTDEFHQTFVRGRSGQIMDVFIDTIGGLLAVSLYVGYKLIQEKKKRVLTTPCVTSKTTELKHKATGR